MSWVGCSEDGQPLTTDGSGRGRNRSGRKGSVPGLDDQGQEEEGDWDGEDDAENENENEDDQADGYLEVGQDDDDDDDDDEAFEMHMPPTTTAEATTKGQLTVEAIDPNGVLCIASGRLPPSIAIPALCR